MNLILVGLSGRDQLAFDLFLKRFQPSWRWRAAPLVKGEALPPADVLVLDLTACGWSQRTERTCAELHASVGCTVALVLVSAHDTSWTCTASTDLPSTWVWLDKPYKAESMREALLRAAAMVKPAGDATLARAKTVAARPVVASKPEQPKTSPKVSVSGLTPQFLAARLAGLPVSRHLLLRKLSEAMAASSPFELRFTVQHSLLVHPVDAWVASNTPLSVVLRVAGSDAMAASVTVRGMDALQMEDRVHQLGMTPHDLNDFLAELYAASVPTGGFDPVSS